MDRKPLSLSEYYSLSGETDRFKNNPNALTQLSFGLFGEVGGLLSAVKKAHRDTMLRSEREFAAEELGDALWYLISLAAHFDVQPDDLGRAAVCILTQNAASLTNCADAVTFAHLDNSLLERPDGLLLSRDQLLRQVAEATGRLVNMLAEPQDIPCLTERLATILSLLAHLSERFGLTLGSIARQNITKIQDRWPGDRPTYTRLFDEQAPHHERFPRQLTIDFLPRETMDRRLVSLQIRGVNIGDPLSDNRHTPDGYRYHDVFHLSYAAHLGWSPVLRALLRLKRKSSPRLDENEDGARAIIIEEGIATWIFNHALQQEFYKSLAIGKLDYSLLKQIRAMVVGYEVERCPSWQWERAIVDGFDVFRQLMRNGGGRVQVDLTAHTISYSNGHANDA